jgi:glycosyltransferase involved in cell wall biosynthesis
MREKNSSELDRPLKVGILANGFVNWSGGIDFLRIIATSLRAADPTIQLHVFAPMFGSRSFFCDCRYRIRRLFGLEIRSLHHPNRQHLISAFAETGAHIHWIKSGKRALDKAAKNMKLDALIPAFRPLTSSSIPWVGYIFDFQHVHLPHFFSNKERVKRNHRFAHMVDTASTIVVNARDVLKDIDSIYPERRARVFSMPFCPAPTLESFSVDIKDACHRYGITRPYFIVCNQFWKHKDHGTVFRAFAALAKSHPDVLLVCTGEAHDYRFPSYFDELMSDVIREGVADRIHILGLIPKLDQLALIRGAIALVQPTRFEGGPGGGAVYDAVSLGKCSIVSDISINREIPDAEVALFHVGDDVSLLNEMSKELLNKTRPILRHDQLIDRGLIRRRACGDLLLTAINHAISKKNTKQ